MLFFGDLRLGEREDAACVNMSIRMQERMVEFINEARRFLSTPGIGINTGYCG